jgi:hypothetical protein
MAYKNNKPHYIEGSYMTRSIILSIAILSLSACTTAGPYVTNLSSDGNNGLNIEKCTVRLNSIMGMAVVGVSTGECSTQNIKLRSN